MSTIWIIGFMYVAGRILRDSADEERSSSMTLGLLLATAILWPFMVGYMKYQVSISTTQSEEPK